MTLTPIFGTESVADTGTTDIKAGIGEVYSISNIYFGGAVEIYRVTPSGTEIVDSDGDYGIIMNTTMKVSDTHYIQVKNVSGGSIVISYDGIQLV